MESDDAVISGAGAIADIRFDAPGYTGWQLIVEGSFSSDDEALEETWLEPGSTVRPTLVRISVLVPPNPDGLPEGGRIATIDGGITGLAGDLDTVSVSGLFMYSPELSECDEPGGSVSVRDADGNWYDVLFDGPEGWEDEDVDLMACDGCGTTWFRGQQIGNTCVDFSSLVEFEDRPW